MIQRKHSSPLNLRFEDGLFLSRGPTLIRLCKYGSMSRVKTDHLFF